ncbi:MAG: flagellar basal body rod protein FlgC [Candidatus Paracaedibacteraceae bacterium]|nr:flagellar basal body rod protein FlgC [Candidatus Paracaedibacteraceae bacterium]
MASTLSESLRASTSAIMAQNKRLLVITQNLANADTKPTTPGGEPYKRKTIVLSPETDSRTGTSIVKVKKISTDPKPFKDVYDPKDPAADTNGFVKMPNIAPLMEMVDMREASLNHEANLRAYEKGLKMMEDTIGLLRNN